MVAGPNVKVLAPSLRKIAPVVTALKGEVDWLRPVIWVAVHVVDPALTPVEVPVKLKMTAWEAAASAANDRTETRRMFLIMVRGSNP